MPATPIPVTGGTTLYFRNGLANNIEYSTVPDFSSVTNIEAGDLPIEIENTSPGDGYVYVQIEGPFTIDNFNGSGNLYFVAKSSHINFGRFDPDPATKLPILNDDGTRVTVSLDGVTDYPGLIQNGYYDTDTNLPVAGYQHVNVFNIFIDGSTSTLGTDAGWICQRYYSNGAQYNQVINCFSHGTIRENCGGILGAYSFVGTLASGTNAVIGCGSSGDIGEGAGGIAGHDASGQYISCYSIGPIGNSSGTIGAGGIIGAYLDPDPAYSSMAVIIRDCYSVGQIFAYSGGIVGSNATSTMTISNCYSRGNMSSGPNSGGIVGYITDPARILTITNCYSTGELSADLANGILSADASQTFSNVTLRNCYTTGLLTGPGAEGITSASAVPGVSNCFSEAGSPGGTAGVWSDTHADTALVLGTPAASGRLVVGTTWISRGTDTRYELFNMGYQPYSVTNISLTPTPTLVRTGSALGLAGISTAAAIRVGLSYEIMEITGGDPSSYGTITIDTTTGVISTTEETVPGVYTLYLYNNGSYNVTTFTLTINPPLPTPCCAPASVYAGLDGDSITSFRTGNRLIVERFENPGMRFTSHTAYLKYKMALGSK